MPELKNCQCGAVSPAWIRAGNGMERLKCLGCGNQTGAGRSRERLAEEWNSAGWCGQGPEEDERLIPFGAAWRAQCMRTRKAVLVNLYERACRRGLALDGLVARLRGELGEADMLIARLMVKRNRRELAAVVDRLVQRGIVAKADAAGAKKRLDGRNVVFVDCGKAVANEKV